MYPTIENLAPIIIDTLKLSIELAAKEIISQGNLTNLTEEEVINSIKSFRDTRKGLEPCCNTIMSIYRRKNNQIEFDDIDPYEGILGSLDKLGLGSWSTKKP